MKFVLCILINGDHVCGELVDADPNIILKRPMVLVPGKKPDGSMGIGLHPWGLGLFKDENITIALKALVTFSETVPELQKDYEDMLIQLSAKKAGLKIVSELPSNI
jgi:hypothetical protein